LLRRLDAFDQVPGSPEKCRYLLPQGHCFPGEIAVAIVPVPLALGCATSAKMEIRIDTDGTIRIVPYAGDTLQSRSPLSF
jgi:hypothetical protein